MLNNKYWKWVEFSGKAACNMKLTLSFTSKNKNKFIISIDILYKICLYPGVEPAGEKGGGQRGGLIRPKNLKIVPADISLYVERGGGGAVSTFQTIYQCPLPRKGYLFSFSLLSSFTIHHFESWFNLK